MTFINNDLLRKKITGCWLGKAVGGTLGQPYEGVEGPLELEFYDPVPEDMIPNDDLDLQVLWACIMDKMEKPVVDRRIFAEAWLNNIEFPWDEYGVAIRNLRNGVSPSMAGKYDNWFVNGLGGAIRSEIWACLAPGDPARAAAYAYEDACLDHDGEGLWAEVFLAAMESVAFIESSFSKCIEVALKHLPDSSLVKKSVIDTQKWFKENNDYLYVREKILDKYGNENFTDVVMNIPFIILGLLDGNGDFSRSLCTAVNCGMDADCTGASIGAFMGILNPDSIDEKWLKPIGRKLVINKEISGISHPDTLDEFTELILSLRDRLEGSEVPEVQGDVRIPENLQISVETWFSKWKAMDNNLHVLSVPEKSGQTDIITFPGTIGTLPIDIFSPDCIMFMRFKFKLDKKRHVKVMFNTPNNCRVWVDKVFAFGREGGRMSPSFHRVPINQYKELELEAGIHTITAGIAPLPDDENINWVIGIGDAITNQWLHDAFIIE